MALSGAGDVFVIAPVDGTTERGRVLVYRLVDGSWEEEAELRGSQLNANFGYPLSLSRDGAVLAVGSRDSPNDERRMEFFNLNFDLTNDAPCNAIALPVNGEPQTGFSNYGADVDQPEIFILPTDPGGYDTLNKTVWFTFVAPPSGAVTATTCGAANFDTEIAIFETSNCEDYSVYMLRGYNDDAQEQCAGTRQSFLRVEDLTPGQTYYLVVDGYDHAVGDFGLTLSEVIPPCDNPAIAFDGVDDYLDFGPNQGNLGTGDFTIELMINTDQQPSMPGNHVPIAEKRNGCGGNLFWYLHMIADGRIKMELVECCGQDNIIYSDGPINDGQWHHLSVIRRGNTFSLYVDGQLNGELQNENVSFDVVSNQDLRLGYSDCIPVGIADYFAGQMDEFRLWEVARSAEELIAFQQQELVGDEPGLLAYYNFNDGAPLADNGDRIGTVDLTGSSSVGRMVNFSRQGNTSNWVAGTTGVTQLDRNADGLYDACNEPVDLPTSTQTLAYSEAQLGQNFPNPAGAETSIPLQLSGQPVRANLQITDALGRVVQTIPVPAATNELTLETADFPKGLYFYSLFVDNHLVDTKRMVVSR